MTLRFSLRNAHRDDAGEIAKLVLIATGGLAEYVWSAVDAPGMSLAEIGAGNYAREGATDSYENCVVAERRGVIVGMLHGFEMPDGNGRIEKDPVLRPYAELEDAGSYYISGIALFPDHRGQGIGSALLEAADERARALGLPRTSLICFERNEGAMRLYQRFGYHEVARRPVVPHPVLQYAEGDVVLLAKPS